MLAPYWQAVERTYDDNCKTVFGYLRAERETIIRYIFENK